MAGAGPVVVATVNYRGGGGTVELIAADGMTPLPGYSGPTGAATLTEGTDSVAELLVFGNAGGGSSGSGGASSGGKSPVLPGAASEEAGGRGLVFRITMPVAGSRLYGVTLRCQYV
jgi:hypothetical protein